jgi:hypothetical protein
MAKYITYKQAQQIRADHKTSRATIDQTAEKYGMKHGAMARLLTGKTYRAPNNAFDTSIPKQWDLICLRCGLSDCVYIVERDYDLCPITIAIEAGLTPRQATNGRAAEIGLLLPE